MLLMIDNYDSFTYNLVQYLGELGADVQVYRNDAITLDEVAALAPRHIVISPGPCTPSEAGISVPLINALRGTDSDPRRVPRPPGDRPGVRRPDRARAARDARQDLTGHARRPRRVRRPADSPFAVTRYHSLVIERDDVPADLEVTATSDDGEIMGVRHRDLAVEGVQFHPEAILTEHGMRLLANFLEAGR